MTERRIVEREPIVWQVDGVEPERDRGLPVTHFGPGAAPRLVYPRDSRPMLSGREALGEWFADHLGADRARVFLGDWNGGRSRDIWGVAIRAQFINSRGEESRHPTPGAFGGFWPPKPVGDFAYGEPGGPVFVFTHEAVEREVAVKVAAATAKLVDAWLQGFGLRPEEYAPGRWRGGLVVQPVDVLAPVEMPRRENLAFPVLIDRHGDRLTSKALIREAERIEAPPPVEIPPHVEAHAPGPLGRLLNAITGR